MANPYLGRQMFQQQQRDKRNSELLKVFRERKDAATAFYQSLYNKFARLHSVYRQSLDTRRFSAFKNFVQVNYALAIIESDVSKKVQGMFGTWPYVEFQGTSAEDAQSAKKNSTLVCAQLDAADTFIKAVRFFLEADIYGTAVARLGWRHTAHMAKIRIPDGQGGELPLEGFVTTFDGPDWDVVPFECFMPEDGKLSIAECKYVFHEYPMDLDDIRAGEASGFYVKGSAKQLESAPIGSVDTAVTQVRNFYRDYMDKERYRGNRYDKKIRVVDMVGDLPDELARGGIKKVILTVAEDRVILKERPFPFQHGRLDQMFFAYSPIPDPRMFHGIGKAELVEKMSYLINRYASQKADAIDTSIEPMWLVNELGGVDTQNITTRSGKVIKVAGPVTDDNIRPFSPDLRGIPIAQNEQQQLWEIMQISTGEGSDVGLGAEGPSRETATSVSIRGQRAMTRQMLEIRIAEKMFLEKIAMACRAINKQMLRLPNQVGIIGSEAIINPLTGLPLPQEPTIIDHFDVAMDYRVRAVGSTQMLGKEAQQQNMMTMLQAIQSGPIGQVSVQMLNVHALLTYIFKTLDIPNVTDFFVNSVPQVNEIAAQAGVDPNQAVNDAAMSMESGAPFSDDALRFMNAGGEA